VSRLIIGTRRSKLARIQSAFVRDSLTAIFPGLDIEEKIIVTTGDRILDAPLAKIGDKGLFTREIEQQLLDGEIDMAVHSYKDLPTELPAGLEVGAVLERAAAEDALIGAPDASIENLPTGARVGTSSLRRISQLLRRRPDVKAVDIRGNVNTRLDKLDAGEYDALILAQAGLTRMGCADRISRVLGETDNWRHAVGQGALAVEIRAGDSRVSEIIRSLEHQPTRAATDAERAFLRTLEGGCQVPVGVLTSALPDGKLRLSGMVAGLCGSPFFEGEERGEPEEASEIGERLARRLIAEGAGAVLADIRSQCPKTD
jgi:hydroxymethylbilane synthase